MDNATRLKYLEAMGIDAWVLREKSQEIITEPAQQNNELVIKDAVDEWGILQNKVADCQNCALCNTRNQTVVGSGNVNADWMLIGEAPGENEDLEGKPFVGQAGKLLTEMIRAIGLERDDVYITNVVKCRPPNNRDPKTEEVNACHDYLQQQIEMVKPEIILAIGRIAAQTLLKTNDPLSKLREGSHTILGIPLVVVYHPAYLLRSLLEKQKAWQDLQFAIKLRNR